MFLNHSYLSS